MNKIFKIIGVAIMAAVFVWGGYMLLKKTEKPQTEVISAEKKDAQKSGTKEASIPVKCMRVKRSNLPLRLPISATADVWEKATIKTEVSGVVNSINFDIGDNARKNDILVKLDDSEIKLKVDRAKATQLDSMSKYLVSKDFDVDTNNQISPEEKQKLKNLEAQYQEALRKNEKGQLSDNEFDKVRTAYQEALVFSGALQDEIRRATEGLAGAEISLKEARLELKRTNIRSPFPATISDIMISKGEKIGIGTEVMKLVNLQSLYLKGFALEAEIKHLKKDMMVRIKLDSYPDRVIYGKIASVSPEIDSENKTIKIFINVDNKDNLILPGMHAEIDVEYKVHENIIKVPRTAVIHRGERPLVFRVDTEKKIAEWVYIDVGDKNDEDWIIKGDKIKEGDLIVIEGHITLAHQSKVKILDIKDQQ